MSPPRPESQLRTSGSLSRRLTLRLVLSAAFLTLVLFFVVLAFVRDISQRTQDSILLASATSIMDSLRVEAGQITLDIPYAALSMLGNVSNDRVFYNVRKDGEVLTGYEDLPAPSQAPSPGAPSYATEEYRGASLRRVTLARRLSLDGGPADIEITVAQTREGQTAELARLTRWALMMGGGFFLVSALIGIWAAQSSVQPLHALTGVVSRRGPKDLRPVRHAVPSEMAPLVQSLNRFIERLRVSLARSEDFIAEAAHRVRTPLATVRAQAEITLRRVEKAENRASLREMIRAIDESSRAAGQLLDHAMVTFRTDSLERKPVDLDGLARDLVERLRPVADLKDIDLQYSCAGVSPLRGDAILIQNAVRNILDNAIKYAPSETGVLIDVRQGPLDVIISVTDEAGGFPAEEDTAVLTQRFVRGSNAAGTIGSGLGLTIAREVAEAHGGKLVIEPSSTGAGACVSLSFPLR